MKIYTIITDSFIPIILFSLSLSQSFFGRSYNNLSSISECKNNSECVINKKNRTACKACRLKKCLMVGMSKNGSRYGRRSNWFKIHCLLQEQQQQREQQQQHQQQNGHPPQPYDLNFLNLMDDYSKSNLNRASLSSSSPSISSPDSHNSDSSVEIGDKKKIHNSSINPHKIPPKIPAINPSPLPSQLASFFQLMPPLGPLPLHHLVGSPFTKLMPPPPLASSAHNFLPPSLFASPFHDSLHHLYAQQQSFLSSANLPSPLANLPNNNNNNSSSNNNNNNNKDSINNNLLHSNGKSADFYQKYYFNKINGKFPLSNHEDDNENDDVTPSNSPTLKVDVNSPSSPHSTASSNSPIICDDIQNNPIDLSMKNEDLLNNNTN